MCEIYDEALNYDELVNSFNDSLVNTLRLHGADLGFLTLWVPDENVVRSILSMIESAGLSGETKVILQVSKEKITESDITYLADYCSEVSDVFYDDIGPAFKITFSNIRLDEQRKANVADQLAAEKVQYVGYRYGEKSDHKANEAFGHVIAEFSEGLSNEPIVALPEKWVTIEIGNSVVDIGVDEKDHIKKITLSGEHSAKQAEVVRATEHLMLGQPLVELAEHGSVRLLTKIRKFLNKPAVSGIALPFNSGEHVWFVHKLCQQLSLRYDNVTDPDTGIAASFFDPSPSNEWLQSSFDEKLSKLQRSVVDFLLEQQLSVDVANVLNLQKDLSGWYIRVVIQISDAVPVSVRPTMVRDLEVFLKRTVEQKLQVYYDERRDQSKIRRLS